MTVNEHVVLQGLYNLFSARRVQITYGYISLSIVDIINRHLLRHDFTRGMS
jgi:hypothetical protein